MKFNWVAEDYFENSTFQYDHAQMAISHFNFKGSEIILDVGCGDGKITAEIADKVKSGLVIGIDSSAPMVNFANSQFATTRSNLEFKVNCAEQIVCEDKFDVIFSFACLHWVKDQISFLKGSKNALKKTGKIILTLYPKHNLIWNAIEDTINDRLWKDYFIGYENPHISYDKEIYKNLCIQAGLKIDSLEESVPVAKFTSIQDMESFLRSWLPHTDQVHPHLRKQFISSICQRFLKSLGNNQEKQLGMPFRRLDAILSK